MEQEPDPALIKRVLEAMLHAAATNQPESPDTALEAMAKAAIMLIRSEEAQRPD